MRFPAKHIGFILVGAVMLGVTTSGRAQSRFALAKDEVVVFVGGTNMLRLQQAGHLEAILTHRFVAARPKFRDLSWEADTVFRQGTVIERWRTVGFGTRDAQLRRLGATTVIAQFGRLESMAGPEKLDEFAKTYEQLVDAFKRQAKVVVLVTPTPFEKPPSPLVPDLSKRNADLKLYVQAIRRIAEERKLVLVDLFSDAEPGLTDNGMHIKSEAQAHVAGQIAKNLGVAVAAGADLQPLRQAVVEKHRLWFDYWRPANWKLLYGDDSQRQFTRGGKDYIPFREEWNKLVPMIAKAEQRVWQIAAGGKDPGHARPKPEVLHGDPSADIQEELASFTASDGLQVNLFASEREGLTSPLAIRWDPAGRMYVTVTTTYPHVFPGDVPNDKIIVLEDADGDGKADKSTVFAEGLNIPTGMELGDGGVYIGQCTEIIFLKDTNGDGKADLRRVVLSGFGSGDSHQMVNSFVWSPGGELYMGQGDGNESRVETPWGASHLFQAGFYRFRPRRLQLDPLLDDWMGPANPWGVAFDAWGQIFTVCGAGGVTYLSPGQVPATHRLKLPTIGDPGGYCGIDCLSGRHLPESMRGDFVVGDFKPNRIKRFSVTRDGAGFSLRWKEPLLHSRHRNFRPVDVKVGPDGAIYVVDWYNPLTCHQDDAYRDPRRDKAHGRIWRVSSKAPTTKPRNLAKASIAEVFDALKSPEHWTRYQAKRALTQHDAATVARGLGDWVRSLDAKDPPYEHHLYEALGAYATIEVVEPNLLRRLLQAQDARARAYAARTVGRWHDRLDRPLDLLARSVADDDPQVRLEAVLACAAIPSAQSVAVAARVVDLPMDGWIEYGFTQAVYHLKSHWSPAFRRGELSFARPNHLAAVLNRSGQRDVLGSLKKILEADNLSAQSRAETIATVLAVGGPGEIWDYGLDVKHFLRGGRYDAGLHAGALAQVVNVARSRRLRPAGNPASGDLALALNRLMDHAHPELKAHAITLAGIWNVEQTRSKILAVATDDSLPVSVRAAAFGAIANMKLPSAREILPTYAVKPHTPALRSAAIESLVAVDTQAAAQLAVKLFAESDLKSLDSTATLRAFLSRKGGVEALATAIPSGKLSPDSAKLLLRSLFSTGRSDAVLLAALNSAIGVSAQAPKYSEAYVKRLVSDAQKQGDPKRGALLFESLACSSCHKVGGTGGTDGTGGDVGPDLTAIGTTLSAERIVEELLWPNRQIKEGYSVVQVLTDEGRIHQGYQRRTKESQRSGDLVIQELATGNLITIKKEHIDQSEVAGSPMPTGLTSVLSRSQLLDLIQCLSELGEIK